HTHTHTHTYTLEHSFTLIHTSIHIHTQTPHCHMSTQQWRLLKKISGGAIFVINVHATHSVSTLSRTIVSICCELINSYSNTFLSSRWQHTTERFPPSLHSYHTGSLRSPTDRPL